MSWTRARAVVAAAVVAVALAGCSAQPGTAAVVDGREISQRYVEDAQRDITQVFGDAGAGDVLLVLVHGRPFIDAAARYGVAASDEDAQALAEERAGGEVELSEGALELLRAQLAAAALQSLPDGGQAAVAEVAEDIADMEIVVNPRYGEYDRTTFSFVAEQRPWLGTATP